MKTKMNRKALQAKLNQSFSDYVRAVTDASSKKISKSIKKASKIIAKAIAKEINAGERSNSVKEKPVALRKMGKKQSKAKVIKHKPLSRVLHKINKTTPVTVSQKINEETLGFVSKDGEDKAGKKV